MNDWQELNYVGSCKNVLNCRGHLAKLYLLTYGGNTHKGNA